MIGLFIIFGIVILGIVFVANIFINHHKISKETLIKERVEYLQKIHNTTEPIQEDVLKHGAEMVGFVFMTLFF
jgi:hypothetical protein